MFINNVRPWGGPPSDIEISAGRIVSIRPVARDRSVSNSAPADPGNPASATEGVVIDGRGRLALPTFADVHVHLDSTRLGLPFRPHTGGPGVWAMMSNDRQNWRQAEVSITERVDVAMSMMIARGTTRMRSFAQVDADAGLERLEAVLAGRERHSERSEVQIIAFPQAGLLRESGSAQVLEQALRAGADVVGGIDPCTLDRDPVQHLNIVFGLAEKYQKPIDIHLHEPGALGRFSADLIIERTKALGMQGNVLISHGYGMWQGSETEVSDLVAAMAEADIATATIAPGGSAIPLQALTQSGVRVGLGEDGQRDYWSPYGNADMLDRTWQLAFTSGYRADELIEHSLAVATMGGASIMDRSIPRLAGVADRPGLAVGDPAHLNLIAGETITSGVMDRSTDRTVIHDGVVVAEAMELCSIAD